MRVILLGAGGFIGRHILSELLLSGHEVTAVVRNLDGLPEAFSNARFLVLDLAKANDPQEWLPHLEGADCIVNAAGILRGATMQAIHVDVPRALYSAAEQAGVRQVVLISAISARKHVQTDYSLSKLEGERVLRSTGLQWTVLRPSLVYGDGSYGGTSLIRGMAGLPLITPLAGRGEFAFTPIHVRDLAMCVTRICGSPEFAAQSIELCGPETLDLRQILSRYRSWLGFGKPRFLSIPMPLMGLLGRLGDLSGDGPISTTSLKQMVAGNAGDGSGFEDRFGFPPRSLDEALRDRPAQVQDRWHARLFFLAPAVRAGLVLLWLASAALGLLYGAPATHEFIQGFGLSANWSTPLQYGGSAIDLAVAAVVMLDRKARLATLVQIIVVLSYTLALTIAQPQLWLDPLGPLLKNLPILLLIAVYGAIGDKR